ncbi:MAG: hypothetical protein QOE23_2564 [Pseudonocardiales bacterium]|jgi:Kef-type K+ transport system membrane component KefB/flavin reductase (DIM6/NTAB) family NADH-FMN oxidoreductase RutF|nr:hypothetical protein [Pseudonocardiales bacterium]
MLNVGVARRSVSRAALTYGALVAVPAIIAFWLLRSADVPAARPLQHPPAPLVDHVGQVLVAALVTVAVAGVLGLAFRGMGQSAVVGEMVAGILLGPSALGVAAPGLQARLFPPGVLASLNVLAQVGVLFFMFFIGLEVPLEILRRVRGAALPIGHAAMAVPFVLGTVLVLFLRKDFQPAGVAGLPFALFVALSMSVTAFPVLARILSDRKLLGTHLGTLGLAAAGIGDVTAWCALGVVVAKVRNGSSSRFLISAGAVLAFAAFLWLVARPLLAAAIARIERASSGVPAIGMLIAGFVLGCAALTNWFGVHAIFGAFLAGLVMPRSSRTVRDFASRCDGFTMWVLLPLFFTTIGLQTRLQSVADSSLTVLALVMGVAVVGKVGGTAAAALLTGEDGRSALSLGVMMNCRGLTELVVLNIGASLGVISTDLFSLLVFMTVCTTVMTDPLLRLLARKRPAETPVVEGPEPHAGYEDFTGATIITTGQGETVSGAAVDSFTSVSLEPPLVLFCLHSQSRLRQVLETAQTFTVNFFAQSQQDLAWPSADGETAVVRDFPHHISPSGLPVLSDALAHAGCRVTRQIDAGDHVIVLGTVIERGLLRNGHHAAVPLNGDGWIR